jgi:general secretion pathway protein K
MTRSPERRSDKGARRPPERERGVALVLALLMTALLVVLAVEVSGGARINLRRVENTTTVLRGHELAQAGIEAAKVMLANDLAKGSVDSLQEPWAQPWGPYPMGDGEVAVHIEDANGRLNLNNLVGERGTPDPEFVGIVRNLYRELEVDPGLVNPLVDWLDPDDLPSGPLGAESAYYEKLSPPYRAKNGPMDSLQELLSVRGYDRDLLQRLAPYVAALPRGTLLNVNTAPPEVLLALRADLPRGVVDAIETARNATPFRTVQDLTGMQELREYALPVKWLTTVSRYFLVTSTARLPGAVLTEKVVLDRAASPMGVLERG